MKTKLFSLLIIVLILSACSSDNNSSDNSNGTSYFPLNNSNNWVYKYDSTLTTGRDSIYVSGDTIISTITHKKIKSLAPNFSFSDIHRMLDGKIDRQLMSFISNALKRDPHMTGFSDKLDSYEMSISPEEQNVYQVYNKQDPDPGFMRVPKDDAAYDQEDVRKDKKTLV